MDTSPEGLDSTGGHAESHIDALAEEVARRLHAAHPEFDEVHLLEDDETIPPRPEEMVADASRE